MIVLKTKCHLLKNSFKKKCKWKNVFKKKKMEFLFLPLPLSAFPAQPPPRLPFSSWAEAQPARQRLPLSSLSQAADRWGPPVRSFLFLRQPPMRFGRAPAPHFLPFARCNCPKAFSQITFLDFESVKSFTHIQNTFSDITVLPLSLF